jgi:hypothetical protein
MAAQYAVLYVYQGQNYWQEVERGWGLDASAADLVYAKFNLPTFEWLYTAPYHDTTPGVVNPPGVWTHRLVISPEAQAAGLSPPPPEQPTTDSGGGGIPWWAVGGAIILGGGYLAYRRGWL